MQNLEPILIFITVAEMGSFTHAADSLGIQKGRASTAVRKLEEDVGVRLLHRTTRSVQLTEDGRAFHARARDLLAEVDDLHSMFAGDRVALRGRLRVDLPTEVARTTIVPALPDFMATHPELELEVSSTDRQVDLVQEGFDCVLRLGPITGRDADCPPAGPVAHGQRCQSRLSGALWRPSIARRSPASGTSDNSFFDDAGRKTQWMGISGRRQLRDASVARCATRQQRADLRSRCPRRPWPDSGATLGDWPILGEWSACGDHTRFSSPGARRVPRRSTSEQSVAPSPRIHEMDRRCADAVSGIARRTSSSGSRNYHFEGISRGRSNRMRRCGVFCIAQARRCAAQSRRPPIRHRDERPPQTTEEPHFRMGLLDSLMPVFCSSNPSYSRHGRDLLAGVA